MFNVQNLTKLADYLSALPDDYAAFEMAYYFHKGGEPFGHSPTERHYAEFNGGVNTCGAVACAVGHGPAAGMLVPPSCLGVENVVKWDRYVDELLITGYLNACETDDEQRAFNWMFGGFWSHFDNTPRGAAARIRWMLANGIEKLPLEWSDEDDGEVYIPRREHLDLYHEYL